MNRAAEHVCAASDPAVAVRGALSLEDLGGGAVRPQRLPASAAPMIPTNAMRTMVALAAGVRVRLRTSATWMSALAAFHPIEIVGGTMTYAAAIDLVVDGTVVHSRRVSGAPVTIDTATDQLTLPPTPPVEIRFDDLPGGEKTIELWLPHTAIVDLIEFRADAPIRTAPDRQATRWIHYGSSISHCLEAPQPTGTWPAAVALANGWDLLDLGFAGNAHLDPFVARVIRDTPADVITLKLGINVTTSASMRMRTFAPAVHGFLDTIREGHPETPLVVISPIVSPSLERHAGPIRVDPQTGRIEPESPVVTRESLTLDGVRTVLSTIVAQRRQSDPRLSYVDGRRLFGSAEAERGLLPDGLHPNADGYRIIARRFAPIVSEAARAVGRVDGGA